MQDHRAAYLTYEGEVSNNRGTVRRVASGTARLTESGGDGGGEIEIAVVWDSGLQGVWRALIPTDADRVRFEAVS